jgi:hypothetical protein
MISRRGAFAHPTPSFGRRVLAFQIPAEPPAKHVSDELGDDLRLFAMTFVSGFLFVSVYLA